MLAFDVATLRSPHRVLRLLNETLPAAFDARREHNVGLPPAPGAPAELLQVRYGKLAPGPDNESGATGVLMLEGGRARGANRRFPAGLDIRMLARLFTGEGARRGRSSHLGRSVPALPRATPGWRRPARNSRPPASRRRCKCGRTPQRRQSGLCLGHRASCRLQRSVDNPFEWVGVLREIFAVSDSILAEALRAEKRFRWDEPESYTEPVAVGPCGAQTPSSRRLDAESATLESFCRGPFRSSLPKPAEKVGAADPTWGFGPRIGPAAASCAAELGLEGAGPRVWLRDLLAGLNAGRPTGYSSGDAINLLTVHSAMGLEWPVVIPIGLWRAVCKREGYRLAAGARPSRRSAWCFLTATAYPGRLGKPVSASGCGSWSASCMSH